MAKEVKIVIFAGAGGGIVSWAFTIITGATFGLNKWEALPLCIILGAASALFAVYIITPTDVKKTAKLIAFSVLCGFLWKPVLDAGRLVITQRLEVNQTTARVQSEVAQLKTAPPAAIPAKVHDTADAAAELLRAADRVGSPDLVQGAADQATVAADVIVQTSTADPRAATFALQEIKIAAAESKNAEVETLVAQRIKAVETMVKAGPPGGPPP